jgi:hypothetical protein
VEALRPRGLQEAQPAMAPLGWLNPTICTRVNGLTLTKRLHGASSPVRRVGRVSSNRASVCVRHGWSRVCPSGRYRDP